MTASLKFSPETFPRVLMYLLLLMVRYYLLSVILVVSFLYNRSISHEGRFDLFDVGFLPGFTSLNLGLLIFAPFGGFALPPWLCYNYLPS